MKTKALVTLLMVLPWMATPAAKAQPASVEEAQVIAEEAYIHFYPLVLMDITRKQLTNLGQY